MKIVGWWRCLYVKVLQMRGAHVSQDGDGDALVVFVVGWPRTASKAVNLRQMSRRKGGSALVLDDAPQLGIA